MEAGVIYPQIELGGDTGASRCSRFGSADATYPSRR
jgi:hypothetical protein